MAPKAKPKAGAAQHKLEAIDLSQLRATPEELAAARKMLEQAPDPIAAKKNNMAQMAHWAKANNIEDVAMSRGSTRQYYSEKYLTSA